MCTDKDRPPCEHDDLIGKVDRLQGQVARLTTTIKELRKQLAAAQRAGKRQAAPFSEGRRTSKPRRPGRKPGTGVISPEKSSAECQKNPTREEALFMLSSPLATVSPAVPVVMVLIALVGVYHAVSLVCAGNDVIRCSGHSDEERADKFLRQAPAGMTLQGSFHDVSLRRGLSCVLS